MIRSKQLATLEMISKVRHEGDEGELRAHVFNVTHSVNSEVGVHGLGSESEDSETHIKEHIK